MDVPRPGCPKHMIFGPCGGVRPDRTCEVDHSHACVFTGQPGPDWSGAHRAAVPSGLAGHSRPLIVTDLHSVPRDPATLRHVAEALRGTCDTVLVADHGARHGDLPPSYLAGLLVGWGIRPWVTLACRDRNRAALAAECAALADLGVAGVHCVTGDWQHSGEAQVFDLDALRLVDLAAGCGLAVSVAATPAAPPREDRLRRLADKAAAGAGVCFVNHCGGPTVVAAFVERARAAGADLAYLPCVPVISDPASAAALAVLPGLVLDDVVTERVSAAGGDPEAGVRAAATEATAMLRIPGVEGVNLSGAASTRSVEESAAMMAALGRTIKP